MNPNLELWNKVQATPPEYTKPVKYGARSFTAIDPTFQNRQATELWGPQGKAWGLKDLRFQMVESKGWDKQAQREFTETSMVLYCVLFYPGGEVPVVVDDKFRAGDDVAKKLRTAAKSKALAELGFAADVFLGMYDDASYVKAVKVKFEGISNLYDTAVEKIRTARDDKSLKACEDRVIHLKAQGDIGEDMYADLMDEVDKRKAELKFD